MMRCFHEKFHRAQITPSVSVTVAFLHWFHEIFQSFARSLCPCFILPSVFPVGIFNEFWWHLQEISTFLDGNQKAAGSRKITYFTDSSWSLKSVHFKKTVARISILSELWHFQYKSKQKVPQFWKKQDLRNCLLKMNGL